MHLIKIEYDNKKGWLRSFNGGSPDITPVKENALKFAKKDVAKNKVKRLSNKYPDLNFDISKYK
jgi:hypothetical protein